MGGARYWDAATDDVRLTLATVLSAQRRGGGGAEPRVGGGPRAARGPRDRRDRDEQLDDGTTTCARAWW